MNLYHKYNKEQGVQLTHKEQRKLFGPQFDMAKAETLMSLTMFRVRENAAATLIQSLFRGYKCRQWYKMITKLRLAAAIKI